jgi:HSP20 family protein
MASTDPRSETPLSSPLDKIKQEFDRLVDLACSQGDRAMQTMGLKDGNHNWVPDISVVELAETVTVEVDLPGVDPAEIEITLAGNMLTLSGERACQEPSDEQTVHCCERVRGAFNRSIPLPVAVNPDQVKAAANNGVLQVTLDKSESSKPTKINVQISKDSPSA